MSGHLDILFVHCSDKKYEDVQMYGFHFMPVWAYTLAGLLESSDELKHLAYDLYDQRFERNVEIPNAQIYLFSGINQDVEAIRSTVESIKQNVSNAVCILGGPIVQSYNDQGKLEILSSFDGLYLGDGEVEFIPYIKKIIKDKIVPPKYMARPTSLKHAKRMSLQLLQKYLHRYYGGVIEVSRGCPFRCSFCDIAHHPNARALSYKSSTLIIEELDRMHKLGVRQVMLACDNFIGSKDNALEICREIIKWREETSSSISLYTWCTINISNNEELLKLMRTAGFDFLFIGIESFNESSLIEANKGQNAHIDSSKAIQKVQSYGFIIVAGLIVGFDCDPEDSFDTIIKSIEHNGLLSGDLSPLIALPGTPLYKARKSQGRLREGKFALGHYKFETNIVYNHSRQWLVEGFKDYHKKFSSGEFQYRRFHSFLKLLNHNNYTDSKTGGYADIKKLLNMACSDYRNIIFMIRRLKYVFLSFERSFYFVKTLILFSSSKLSWVNFKFYLLYWLYNWTNSYLKYENLNDADFDFKTNQNDATNIQTR